MHEYKREIYHILFSRLKEKRRFIQVLAGPRQKGKKLLAIEVKSNRYKETPSGMKAFCDKYKSTTPLLVGGQNLSVETFLKTPITRWFE